MTTPTIDLYNVNEVDNTKLASKLISAFTMQNVHSDLFYLTGFECICINANHAKLSEAVISTAIPFDGELLIIGNDDSCTLWRNICHQMDIKVSAIDGNEDYISSALEAILKTNKNISHIICGSQYSDALLRTIGTIAHQYRCTFIVDNCNNVVTMANINDYKIDFLVTADSDDAQIPTSIVIARRSKLVQTEGNARSKNNDIYAMWQQIVGIRKSTLEPMA